MDVTAHDLMQPTLLGEALEHAPVGIVVFDAEGTYLAVNRFGHELLGYSRNEFLTLSPSELAARPEQRAAAMESLEREGRVSRRTTVLRKDGGRLSVTYRSFATRMAGMDVFVSVFEPVRRGRASRAARGPTA